MFHKAVGLQFNSGTELQVSFQNGEVKKYDMAKLFVKYPSLKALKNRDLFCSGKLMGFYGIVWNDDLDIETETIYEDGVAIEDISYCCNIEAANAVLAARAKAGISQKELSLLTGIDQSDISKIERGIANPSIKTLERIATALGAKVMITIS